ncbi:EscU/YscU/HrcU family type III secretion system export apparatus switch protein [Robertmurraya massiliosenegalensis]|uniref:EscU/YscU/HrcU family type III secretion system export apparatus switch protein n=1 Tax=Robertmurraya massiliosenegalensis TaxID=1287657 RepID=UPI0002D7DEFC|nr:EscU/YscU/HrcU family type III secretion system export apparatus switch protein [Robertmurraya massiliosenegalensis]
MMKSKNFLPKNGEKISSSSKALIRYNQGTRASEGIKVSSKVAKKIVNLAKENKIELQEDEVLMNMLLSVDMGESVPPQIYAMIAQTLLLLDELERSY